MEQPNVSIWAASWPVQKCASLKSSKASCCCRGAASASVHAMCLTLNDSGRNSDKEVFTKQTTGPDRLEYSPLDLMLFKQQHADLEKIFIKSVLKSEITGCVKVRINWTRGHFQLFAQDNNCRCLWIYQILRKKHDAVSDYLECSVSKLQFDFL